MVSDLGDELQVQPSQIHSRVKQALEQLEKSFDRDRSGRGQQSAEANEHNGQVPRDWWLDMLAGRQAAIHAERDCKLEQARERRRQARSVQEQFAATVRVASNR